jgi:PAS domain S-box-containing protein
MTPQANIRLQALRSRAEDKVYDQEGAQEPTSLQQLSHEAMRKMVHELQVHKIELEMQNEELRHTQAELDSARSRYFDLYDLAPVGYCTICENGLIIEANFTAAALLNEVRSELVNKHVGRLIVKSDQDVYYRCRKALFETGKPQDCELQMLKRSGAAFWVHLQITATNDTKGTPVQRMVLSDITERKQLDNKLLVQNQELEIARNVADKASQAKTDFLSNMTHELRSPLNAILGFAQLLQSAKPSPSPAQSTNINQILRAGWYLLDLVGEILDLTSIEAGQLKLNLEPVSVSDVLRDCHNDIAAEALKKNLHLHFEPVSKTLMVHADPGRLAQVVKHLLSNAVKYNRTGGDVDVTCSLASGNRLRLAVRDSGYGLSADKINHLFRPFNRLGRETTAEEGTGVGLALSKRLVELMGGVIGAHSTISVGSVFWIELNVCSSPIEGAA